MMRQLSSLSEREQDNLFYIALERAKKQDLSDLLSMLYLSPLSGADILVNFRGYEFASQPVFKLRECGVEIKLKGGRYRLTGIDDGNEGCMMHFKNTHAPHIKLRGAHSRGRKQDNATMSKLKRREQKRKIAQDADMFSKLVMEMVL